MEFNLSTGKTVDFNLGVIGIGDDLDLCEGCDGSIIHWETIECEDLCRMKRPYVHYTKQELIAMAKYGISKFEPFIEKVNDSPDAWFEEQSGS